MLSPIDVPADPKTIDPWIAEIINSDGHVVTSAINKRLAEGASEHTAPLRAMLAEFVPRRIEFSRGIGYVLCLKRKSLGRSTIDVTDQIYIAQPLPEDEIRKRCGFFQEAIQPLMGEFLRKFAGCGEQKEGFASQFVMMNFVKASEIADMDLNNPGKWNNARLIYAALNGDSVFIDQNGSTAWHVLETNEIVPLFETFPEFIKHYANFRESSEVFDSFASREFLGIRSQK